MSRRTRLLGLGLALALAVNVGLVLVLGAAGVPWVIAVIVGVSVGQQIERFLPGDFRPIRRLGTREVARRVALRRWRV